jgi:hypothetical protein
VKSVVGAGARFAALSIDLDELHHYRRIHGLPSAMEAAHAVYDVAIPRAIEFARRHSIALTFFAVGEDLAREESASALVEATRAGHVVESHSMTHPYDLVRRSRSDIADEVGRSFDVIEKVTGRRPLGFRAPGYTISNDVLDALESVGAHFDSSVFPSPAYYLAKVAALTLIAARGASSASILGSPRVMAAPTELYRPGATWWERGERSLIEVPIRVTSGPRFPVFGTSLAIAGESAAPWLIRACSSPQLFNIELHGVDFLGVEDGIEDVARLEPSLRIPLEKRMRTLDSVVAELRRARYEIAPLDRAIAALA